MSATELPFGSYNSGRRLLGPGVHRSDHRKAHPRPDWGGEVVGVPDHDRIHPVWFIECHHHHHAVAVELGVDDLSGESALARRYVVSVADGDRAVARA